MSVVGFDVGNDACCVALARKRGIDVLMNKESKRETPAMVSFGDKMRFLGVDAYGKVSMNPKNTVHQLKRLLGKKFNDPDVQADIAKLPYKVTESENGGILVHVRYCNEEAVFTPEQLVAMIIVDMKKIAEAESGIPVTDCCISVPTFYTEAERAAMLDAATIAGVNCLRLVNETTAAALSYGIYKTDLPETDPVHVAFVDVGHSSTQVSIVAFKKSGLQVKSHAWERNLGGRDLDEVLFEHFASEFKQKTGLDVRTNPKAAFKLRNQVEKLKKILSANAESSLNVECLMEDMDLRGTMTREQFEKLAEPVLARLRAPLEEALAASGVPLSEIASVELVGSTTRVPAVFRTVEEIFQKMPSRTLNSKECICRGCALMCAMLSPMLKVRDYDVVDACPYSVAVAWDKDGERVSQVLFERNSPYPTTKAITLMRAEPFTLEAYYPDQPQLPAGAVKQLGKFTVGPFQVPAGAEKAKVKVFFEMNLHGMLTVNQAKAIIEEEVDEPSAAPAAATAAEAAPAGANGDAGDAAAGPAPMEAEASAGSAGEGDAAGPAPATDATAAPAPEKKKRIKKVDVPIKAEGVAGYSQLQRDRHFEAEHNMQAADKLQEDTNESKNALEAYIYDLRNKLYDQLAPFVKEADREALCSQLTKMEDWLYNEGEDEKKSVYVVKLEELLGVGRPIEERYQEEQSRPGAIDELRRAADTYQSIATSDLPQYSHLEADERNTVVKEAEAARSWLNEKLALQAQLHKYDEPVLRTADINKKKDVLDRVAKPIVNKKPPPPPKKDTPPAAPAAPTAEDPAFWAGGAGAGEEEFKDAVSEPMEAEGSGVKVEEMDQDATGAKADVTVEEPMEQ